jgi:hypothetical protein
MADHPKTLISFRLHCAHALFWLDSDAVKKADWRLIAGGIDPYPAVRLEAKKRLRELHESAIRLWSGEPDVPEPPEMPDVNTLDWLRAVIFVKRLRQWVIPQIRKQAANTESVPVNPNVPAEPPITVMSWQEVAEKLERLRSQGEPFTTQRKLVTQIGGSSPGTVNKAIHNTPSLQAWAGVGEHKVVAAPKARSLNDVVTDRTAQSTEPDPAEEAEIREFVESADPETKGWFLAIPREAQLDYLHDPDRHPRILGRKA